MLFSAVGYNLKIEKENKNTGFSRTNQKPTNALSRHGNTLSGTSKPVLKHLTSESLVALSWKGVDSM